MTSPDLTEQQLRLYWSRIQRAVEVLQRAQRYHLNPHGDFYQGEGMASSDSGDWLEWDDVVKAIQILQEGQQ